MCTFFKVYKSCTLICSICNVFNSPVCMYAVCTECNSSVYVCVMYYDIGEYMCAIHCTHVCTYNIRTLGDTLTRTLSVIEFAGITVSVVVSVISPSQLLSLPSSLAGDPLERKPTVMELQEHIVGSKMLRILQWETVCRLLGVESKEIESVKRDHPNDNVGAFRECLFIWHMRSSGVTWERLLEAVEKTGEKDLVSEVKRKLGGAYMPEGKNEHRLYWIFACVHNLIVIFH